MRFITMAQMTTYTVRYKHLVNVDKVQYDEILHNSPCEAYSTVQNLLESPYLLSYKILKEEILSLDELKSEMRESLEIVKKD